MFRILFIFLVTRLRDALLSGHEFRPPLFLLYYTCRPLDNTMLKLMVFDITQSWWSFYVNRRSSLLWFLTIKLIHAWLRLSSLYFSLMYVKHILFKTIRPQQSSIRNVNTPHFPDLVNTIMLSSTLWRATD
jgi:hypothetical protein